MSTTFPPSSATGAAAPRKPGGRPAWTREPLLHFVLLGAVLFGVDHAIVSRKDDPRVIVMGAEVDAEARKTFEAARGRTPTATELAALRQVWLNNEVLYREGLAMEVDRGDDAIRERVIFKALSVVDANTKLPEPTDAVLKKFFEERREKYDDPARYDFQEAALEGETGEAAVRAFVAELNNGAPGDARAGLRVFKNRPKANLIESYGPDFATALESAPVGRWQALSTRNGWRAVIVDARTPAKPGDFEVLRGVVQQDWTDAELSAQRSAAVAVLTKKYTVRSEGASK